MFSSPKPRRNGFLFFLRNGPAAVRVAVAFVNDTVRSRGEEVFLTTHIEQLVDLHLKWGGLPLEHLLTLHLPKLLGATSCQNDRPEF